MIEEVRIAFAGGGTGGHLFPALNIADALREKQNCTCLFFGTQRGLEKTKVPLAGYPIEFIPVAGFQRRLTLKNLSFPWKLYRSMKISRQKLREFNAQLVIGTGGYVMGPVLKSAQKLGIPTVLQEQNSFPGVTTRLLAKRARLILLAYEEAANFLDTKAKIVFAGNPIRSFSGKPETVRIFKRFGLNPDKKLILIFGGSQGAVRINSAVRTFFQDMDFPEEYQFLWQTGQRDFDDALRFIEDKKLTSVKAVPFIDDMVSVYAHTDFAICRAGAMSLSELLDAKIPAILVPLPSAAGNHQFKNAKALVDRGVALVVKDDAQLAEHLRLEVLHLMNNEAKKKTMRRKADQLPPANGLERIMDEIELLIKEIEK